MTAHRYCQPIECLRRVFWHLSATTCGLTPGIHHLTPHT